MRNARRLGAAILSVALGAGGVLVWNRVGGSEEQEAGPAPTPAPAPVPSEPEPPGLVIHGFVQGRSLDPKNWSVRATPLRYEARQAVATADINSRGRFELVHLAEGDYRVELLVAGEPPFVLAEVNYVRAGGEELVLEPDPLRLSRLAAASRATQ